VAKSAADRRYIVVHQYPTLFALAGLAEKWPWNPLITAAIARLHALAPG
jgi:hypothetical protein